MITFKDGPAFNSKLVLTRAPFFLRVVVSQKQGLELIDALNLLEDKIESGETPYCYVMVEGPFHCHIKAAKPARSGWYLLAGYKLFTHQPSIDVMSDNPKWREWCLANRHA